MDYQCPICGKVIPSSGRTADGRMQINAPFFPFCSSRCRLLDLGAWMDGRYAVPIGQTESAEQDDLSADGADTAFPEDQQDG